MGQHVLRERDALAMRLLSVRFRSGPPIRLFES